jgi:tRNA threonylcarbamoyladenosine biosynthesis protein TsaB
MTTDQRDPLTRPLLTIDTCEEPYRFAILNGEGSILSMEEIDRGQGDSTVLSVGTVMNAAKLRFDDLGLIGVTTGPGPLTRVRIGIAVARGMAAACNCPSIGVSNADAMATELSSATHLPDVRVFLIVLCAPVPGGCLVHEMVRDGDRMILGPLQRFEQFIAETAACRVAMVGHATNRELQRLSEAGFEPVPTGISRLSPMAIASVARRRALSRDGRARQPSPLYLHPAVTTLDLTATGSER